MAFPTCQPTFLLLLLLLLSALVVTTDCSAGNSSAAPRLEGNGGLLVPILVALAGSRPQGCHRGVHVVCPPRHFQSAPEKRKLLADLEVTVAVTSHYDAGLPSAALRGDVVFCVGDDDDSGASFVSLVTSGGPSSRATRSDWFAVGPAAVLDSVRRRAKVAVNQRVYFVSTDAGTVSEVYHVKGREVSNAVGQLARDGEDKVLYRRVGKGLSSFVERRSSLEGAELDAMIEMQPPFLFYEDVMSVKTSSDGWSGEDGDAVKDISEATTFSGPFYEVLARLRRRMNFTTRLWTRRDFDFGSPVAVNGTDAEAAPAQQWTGMIGNLLRGEAEFAVASLTQTTRRFDVLDFLLPMGAESLAFYVPRGGLERREWLSFLYPLRAEVWICLCANSIVLLLALKVFELFYYGRKRKRRPYLLLVDAVSDFWMLGASYFGRKPVRETPKSERAIRLLLLLVFLSGNIVFMSYRASLTAELAVRRRNLPFDSLEELLDSDIQVMSFSGIGTFLSNFEERSTSVHSLWARVYEEKIKGKEDPENDVPVIDMPKTIRHLTTTSVPTTFLFFKETMLFFPEYRCSIEEVFASRYPSHLSYGFPKGSPYRDLINYQLLKIVEEGGLDVLHKRHVEDRLECSDADDDADVSLSFTKLVSLFAILGLGIACSLLLFFSEGLLGTFGHGGEKESDDPDPAQQQQQNKTFSAYEQGLKSVLLKWGVSGGEDNRGSFEADLDRGSLEADLDELVELRQLERNSVTGFRSNSLTYK